MVTIYFLTWCLKALYTIGNLGKTSMITILHGTFLEIFLSELLSFEYNSEFFQLNFCPWGQQLIIFLIMPKR